MNVCHSTVTCRQENNKISMKAQVIYRHSMLNVFIFFKMPKISNSKINYKFVASIIIILFLSCFLYTIVSMVIIIMLCTCIIV